MKDNAEKYYVTKVTLYSDNNKKIPAIHWKRTKKKLILIRNYYITLLVW
jgi:hypothetical protein